MRDWWENGLSKEFGILEDRFPGKIKKGKNTIRFSRAKIYQWDAR